MKTLHRVIVHLISGNNLDIGLFDVNMDEIEKKTINTLRNDYSVFHTDKAIYTLKGCQIDYIEIKEEQHED